MSRIYFIAGPFMLLFLSLRIGSPSIFPALATALMVTPFVFLLLFIWRRKTNSSEIIFLALCSIAPVIGCLAFFFTLPTLAKNNKFNQRKAGAIVWLMLTTLFLTAKAFWLSDADPVSQVFTSRLYNGILILAEIASFACLSATASLAKEAFFEGDHYRFFDGQNLKTWMAPLAAIMAVATFATPALQNTHFLFWKTFKAKPTSNKSIMYGGAGDEASEIDNVIANSLYPKREKVSQPPFEWPHFNGPIGKLLPLGDVAVRHITLSAKQLRITYVGVSKSTCMQFYGKRKYGNIELSLHKPADGCKAGGNTVKAIASQ